MIAGVLLLSTKNLKAQATTAMQLSGTDCNGVYHDLFADLDAGKVVLLHFFMASCGSCPPPAQAIQAMANNVMMSHPGMITGYAIPFNNTTDCNYTAAWVSSNGLSLYAPFDSGQTQVAHYGGFGMPTVVMLAGSNHSVLFTSLSFSISDTTEMRDSILSFFNSTAGINDLPNSVAAFNVFPNPVSDVMSINLELKESSSVLIDITGITGKQIAIIADEKQSTGFAKKQFSTSTLPNGNYLVRLSVNGKSVTKKISITH